MAKIAIYKTANIMENIKLFLYTDRSSRTFRQIFKTCTLTKKYRLVSMDKPNTFKPQHSAG